MSAHTSGPWNVQLYLVNRFEEEVHTSGPNSGPYQRRCRVIADDSPMVIADMVAGNADDAHLIAAAPELLEAAHKALAEHEDAGCSCGGCAALRAAIAKAEGRS